MTARRASTNVGTELQLGPEARPIVGTELQVRPERPVRKPRPRLSRDAYLGMHTYHITLTTTQRAPFFELLEHAESVQRTLVQTAEKLQFRLLAYCLMPDHLHVLLKGETRESDLIRFIQRFKQITSFHFKQVAGVQLWQQSFYDRVLRRTENPATVARYIFENPVEERLPAGSIAYPIRGGDYYERYVGADRAEAPSLRRLSFDEEEQL